MSSKTNYIPIGMFITSFVLAACGGPTSSPPAPPQTPPTANSPQHQQQPQLNDDETLWRAAVAVNPSQTYYSAQELVNYLNGHFPIHQLNAGDRVYRCVNPGQERDINFPVFVARTQNFAAFNHDPTWGSGLCTMRNLYAYRVTQNIQLTQFLTQRRYELPNGTIVRPLASVQLFHHLLHRGLVNGHPLYQAHILDNTIDASITQEPAVTQQILAGLHPQAIGRVVYFCNRVLNDPISRAHNLRNHVNGWLDYDPAFAPPTHGQIPTLSQAEINTKEEVLLCNPEQYLDPNPELVRANLL